MEKVTLVPFGAVQPTGDYKVYADGVEIISDNSTSDISALAPNVPGTYANSISIGRNIPDRWSAFNGKIGDVPLYKTALSDAERKSLEGYRMTKFVSDR